MKRDVREPIERATAPEASIRRRPSTQMRAAALNDRKAHA